MRWNNGSSKKRTRYGTTRRLSGGRGAPTGGDRPPRLELPTHKVPARCPAPAASPADTGDARTDPRGAGHDVRPNVEERAVAADASPTSARISWSDLGGVPGEDFPRAVSGPAQLARCATHGHVRQTRVRCRTGPESSTTAESARTREAMFLTFCGAADMPSQSRPVETANEELEISSL